MMKLNKLDWVALILLVIGGLNWGSVVFGWNLVSMLFSTVPFAESAVYALVGLSALYVFFFVLKKLMAPKPMM